MSDIKDNLRRLVLSLSEDEVHAVLAIVQSSMVEETGDVTCGTVPNGLTKADCKRLIKTMREKQSAAPASVQPADLRGAVHHLWTGRKTEGDVDRFYSGHGDAWQLLCHYDPHERDGSYHALCLSVLCVPCGAHVVFFVSDPLRAGKAGQP